jgi:hypothetical protein
MKGNPMLIIVTRLKPIAFATLQIPEIMAFVPWKIQGSRLRNKDLENENE